MWDQKLGKGLWPQKQQKNNRRWKLWMLADDAPIKMPSWLEVKPWSPARWTEMDMYKVQLANVALILQRKNQCHFRQTRDAWDLQFCKVGSRPIGDIIYCWMWPISFTARVHFLFASLLMGASALAGIPMALSRCHINPSAGHTRHLLRDVCFQQFQIWWSGSYCKNEPLQRNTKRARWREAAIGRRM